MRKKIFLFFLCFSIISLLSTSAFSNTYLGNTPLGLDFISSTVTEGPYGSLMVMSPGTGKHGDKSIGSGFSYIKNESLKFYQFPFSVSYTFIDGLDLSLGLPVSDMTKVKTGFGDLFIGGKYKLNNDFFKSAVSLGLVLPTGADRLTGSNNKTDILLDLPVEKEFEYCILNLNTGIAFVDVNADNDQTIIKLAAAVSRSINKKIGVSIEMMYQDSKMFSSLLTGCGLKYTLDNASSITGLLAKDLHSSGLDILFSLGYSQSF